jgi:predicted transcriptional regulator
MSDKKQDMTVSYSLGDSEYRFACIVWQHEPVASGALVKLAADELGWKKSTSYTVLKNLIAKGILQNENSVVTARVKQAQVRAQESRAVVARTFEGSLPKFVSAFLGGQTVSAAEADEIRALLDAYTEAQK